jgi:signal transduction histidine kinase
MKLATRLSLLFLLLAVIPSAIVGFIAYDNSRLTIESETVNRIISANAIERNAVSRWVRAKEQVLESAARNPHFINMFAALATPEGRAENRTAMEPFLTPVIQAGGFSELFMLRASDGLTLLSTDATQEGINRQDEPYFTQGKNKTSVNNIYDPQLLNRQTLVISTPLRDKQDNVLAVLAARVNLVTLSAILEPSGAVKQNEDSYLVNKFNLFATDPRYGQDYALKKTIYTQGVQAALAEQDGVAFYNGYRDVPVIGAFSWLPELQMGLITEVEQAEVFAPIYSLQKIIILIGLGIALLSAQVGWLIARSITKPVQRLIEDTREIGRGNLDYSVATGGKDEIGQLSRAFSQMAKGLKETVVSRDILTAEVAERRKAQLSLQESEERLKKMVAELERSNAELQRFAYVASHDLQEPLRMVSSYTQLLEKRYKDKLDADAHDFINFAVDGARRMQNLIDDLLAFSRVGTHGKPFVLTNMEVVWQAAVDNLQVAIKKARAKVTHDPLPTLVADEGQLVQLLQNLIGNAIKFHGKETPAVHVSAVRGNNEWVFAVRDNGIGIESQYFDRIFLVFQRLYREEYPGTGAGLAIAKRIVERHNGRIWLESQPGKGSTFYFSIPDNGDEKLWQKT